MEIIGYICIGAVFLVIVIGVIFHKEPTCAICQKPIYSTKNGLLRHKPGHAPNDGHKAVKEER